MTSSLSIKKQSNDGVGNQRDKYKTLLRRAGKFQSYFSEIWQLISSYTVKAACLRDKNDDIAKCLNNFTKVEEFSTTSKLALAVAAELLASVGDYQDLAVQRIETLVLPGLSSYEIICDSVKADVLNAIQAIKREHGKKKTYRTLKRKSNGCDPKLQKVMDDAKREFERANADATRLCELSEEHVIKFEHKRLMDLKEILGNFVKIQIATHAKSLELLSETYKHIQSIDEDVDLDMLKSSLKIGDHTKKKKSSRTHLKNLRQKLQFKF